MKLKISLFCAAALIAATIAANSAQAACGYSGASYVREHDFTDDAAAAIPIEASRMDTEFDCLATALSSVVKSNGDSPMTGALAMGTHQITGLAAGTAGTAAANVSQFQINLEGSVAATGTVDAILASLTPAPSSLQDKMLVRIIATGANTSTTPTLALNGFTARTIVKGGGAGAAGGDIRGAGSGAPAPVQPRQYPLGAAESLVSGVHHLLHHRPAERRGGVRLRAARSASARPRRSIPAHPARTIPLLNGANTWSALQSLTEALTLDDWQTIASANGTTDIGAATSNLVAVSGTNSITGWGTVAAGTWRIVRATGGWNVTFAATLVGPSGETSGTHTATSGNLYIIVSQGGGTWNMGMLFTRTADQATIEAGTNTTTAISSGRAQFHNSAAKAWCVFDGTAAPPISCADDYNVTNVGSPAAGRFEINFTTAFLVCKLWVHRDFKSGQHIEG